MQREDLPAHRLDGNLEALQNDLTQPPVIGRGCLESSMASLPA